MNLVIGSMGVVLTLAASLTGSLTIVAGLKKSRERLRSIGAKYAWVAFVGMAISTFAMQRALITRDFSVRYVAEQGSSSTSVAIEPGGQPKFSFSCSLCFI